jgi:transposase InsO family protein
LLAAVRTPFPSSIRKATVPLEQVHSDLASPMHEKSLSGKRYMMTIWDEATSFLWSYAIEQKADAYETCVGWQARVERETEKNVRTLRTDNGGEYTSKDFKTHLRNLGIKAETTIPYTPEQNRKAERGNRTIEEKITCLLQDANAIDESERGRYWAEALNTATYIINRLPTSTNNGKTPYEAYYG